MIGALTTLMFLTVLWMIAGVALRMFAQSGERIRAAVAGLPPLVSKQGRRAAA